MYVLHVNEAVAFHAKGLARLAGDRASAAFPFDLILLIHKVDALPVLEFIERKMSQQSGWFIWLGVHIFCGFDCPFLERGLHAFTVGGDLFIGSFQLGLGGLALGLAFLADDIDHWRGVAATSLFAAVGVVVEEREKFVVFLVRYGIILVAVALGAFDAETEENIAGGLHSIDHVFHAVFLYDQAAFIGGAVVTVEAGGDFLVYRCIGYEIAGDLFGGEFFKRFIGVIGIDHPIAPGPHGAWAVGVVHAAVAITRDIHPVKGHPLGVRLGGEQAVDDFFVGVRALVIHERIHFCQGRRQSGEVKGHPANE